MELVTEIFCLVMKGLFFSRSIYRLFKIYLCFGSLLLGLDKEKMTEMAVWEMGTFNGVMLLIDFK